MAVVALMVTVLSDALWTSPVLRDAYPANELLDAAWFTGSILLALAPWVSPAFRSGAESWRVITLMSGLIPYVAAGASAMGLIAALVAGRISDPIIFVVGELVLVALVIRQGATLLDNLKLTRRLAVREDHFRSLVQGSNDVIMITSLDGVAHYVSPALRRVFGFEPADVVGSPLRTLIHPDDTDAVFGSITDFLRQQDNPMIRVDCRIRAKDGKWRHIESSISRHPDGLIFNSRDVSERIAWQEQLTHFAFHDALTGLPNRSLFADRVSHALEQRRAGAEPLAVLFLDLDGFKAVNDSSGHAAGDELLIQTARRLRGSVRSGDTVARFGGDEFAALLEGDADPAAARDVADRLLAALREPYHIDGRNVVSPASIGIACTTPGITSDELMRNADLAMYEAKAAGKGRVEVYVPRAPADVDTPTRPSRQHETVMSSDTTTSAR